VTPLAVEAELELELLSLGGLGTLPPPPPPPPPFSPPPPSPSSIFSSSSCAFRSIAEVKLSICSTTWEMGKRMVMVVIVIS